jgi:hypothetical protein
MPREKGSEKRVVDGLQVYLCFSDDEKKNKRANYCPFLWVGCYFVHPPKANALSLSYGPIRFIYLSFNFV